MSDAPVWAEHLDHGEVRSWSAPDTAPDAFSSTVAAALEALAAVYVPLSVEARCACTSAEEGWIAHEQHVSEEGVLLRASRDDVVVRRMYVGERVDEVPRITPAALGEWLSSLEGRCPVEAAHARRWTELWMESCSVRLSDTLEPGATLRVRAAERPATVHEIAAERADGSAWLAAPTPALRRALVAPPILVRFTNDYGMLRMTLDARWTLFTEATREREALEAVLDGLARSGLVQS